MESKMHEVAPDLLYLIRLGNGYCGGETNHFGALTTLVP